MHTMHRTAAITIALIYVFSPSVPVKSEWASINAAGEYAFAFGMTLNKYAESTEIPVPKITPVLFCKNDENRIIRHITHTPNSHQIKTAKNKLSAKLLSQK